MTLCGATDVGVWARGSGLEIVPFVLGAILFARLIKGFSLRLTRRIDADGTETDELVSSEAAKHRHALVQVLTWTLFGGHIQRGCLFPLVRKRPFGSRGDLASLA